MQIISSLVIVSAVILSGCSDDDASLPTTSTPSSSAFSIQPSFQTCDNVVSQPAHDDLTSQFNCGSLQLPLDWNDRQGKQIDYFVRHLPARETKRAQLWLLAGGPGIAEDDYALALGLAERLPDTEIYMPDHRGTGRSNFLACTEEQSQQIFSDVEFSGEECLIYLLENWDSDELAQFNVTQAAEDIGQLINHFNPDGDEVYLYGTSYGTYWAQRYLHLYPDQASGVFLDAVCSLTSCTEQNGFFATANIAGRELLKLCDDDPFCSNNIGGNAEAYLQNLYALVDSGHCPALELSGEELQFITGALLSERALNALLPPVIYRLTRCSEKDREAILHLINAFENDELFNDESIEDEPELEGLPESEALSLNIRYSELWDNNLTPADIEAQAQTALFAGDGFGDEEMAQYNLQAQWPVYALDSFANSWPNTTIPMLITTGMLDPYTTVESAAELALQYVQPNQQTIVIPFAGHETLGASPIANSDEDCTANLATQFFQNPQQELDKSCLDNLQAPDFEGNVENAITAFNTMDYWENP